MKVEHVNSVVEVRRGSDRIIASGDWSRALASRWREQR